jgi:flagellar M-ring protein FliF
MNALIESLKALGTARLAAMGTVTVVLGALLAVLAGRAGDGGRMALLYADLDTREAAQIAEQLDAQHIPHEISAAGDRVMVAENEVGRARLLLARQGLPSGGSIGYELFDRGDALTASSFQQQINQARAMEGELSRTIRIIDGVRAARVHLVLPHREPFAREQQDAQASVMLVMSGGNRLDREGVQAIVNLVSAAVPGLRPRNVAVIDSRGDVLARAGEPVDGEAGQDGLQDVRHTTELRLARAVEEMLERTVGAGRVRAEAAVDLDFAHVNETQERFDPDGQVTRSSQTVNETTKSTEPGQTVSVQNNLPNADAAAGSGGGSQTQRQEETTNYEIGKTVRTLVREQPEIRRISLAVLVDGTTEIGADGKPHWKPRSADELERLAALVRGAIGYDEKRGDHVEVVNLRFVDEDAPQSAPPRAFLGLHLGAPDATRLAQTGLFALVAILGMLIVLRPMVRRLAAAPEQAALSGRESDAPGLGTAGISAPDPARLLPAPAGATTDEGLVEVAHVQGQMRALSIRRIADLVDRHPEESLSIVRAWMQQEAG